MDIRVSILEPRLGISLMALRQIHSTRVRPRSWPRQHYEMILMPVSIYIGFL